MRYLKITLSVLFVLIISFFVVKSCVHKRPSEREVAPKKIIHKKVKVAAKEEAVKEYVAPAEAPKGPRMAIILDDWGYNFSLVKLAVDIQRPVTLSILPHLPNSRRIAEEAYKQGLGVMLHMPMQPKNRAKGLEPHTILLTTPDSFIIVYLDRAIAETPHVEGVNNHMGSAATSDLRVMRTVLKHLLFKSLFFIDSNTASTTVGAQVAKEVGIKFNKRDVFIDNEMKPEAIKAQLRQAVNIAMKRGSVIVIGHDRKMTLLAIKEMIPEIEASGIKFVLVRDLVQ